MTDKEKVKDKEGEKLYNANVFVAMPVIGKLSELDFPVTDSIELRKLRQALAPTHEIITGVRDSLIRKHGQEALKSSGQLEVIGPNDKKGRPMSKSWPKFMEESNELMNKAIEVDFKKLKLPSKIDDKPIPLSANDLDRIEVFIEVV